MRSWKKPTPEQVERATALLAKAQQRRQFFERLDNPLWLAPLRKAKWFSSPPSPVVDESAGTVRHVPWPEIQYVSRMAREPDGAKDALGIALDLPETENVIVREAVADIAVALAPAEAARLVQRLKGWTEGSFTLLPKKLGELAVRLAVGGQPNEALDLCRALLRVKPERHRDPEIRKLFGREAEPLIDSWAYGEVLEKHFPKVVEVIGVPALDLVCDILVRAIDIRRNLGRPEDASEIWRPFIETERYRERVLEQLVSAVLASSRAVAGGSGERLVECVALLRRRRWLVFDRVAMWLARELGLGNPQLLSSLLLDDYLFDRFCREYRLLLRDGYCLLAAGERDTLLARIERGPDLERLQLREIGTGAQPSEEELREFAGQWRLARLATIGDALPAREREERDSLRREFGEPAPADQPGFVSDTWVGPTSPRSAADLREMGVQGTVEFLRTWRSQEDIRGPSPEGLSRVLAEGVAEQPEAYAAAAEMFIGLDPTYVRGLVFGLARAAQEGKAFPWGAPLRLIAWLLAQPLEAEKPRLLLDRDTGWSWGRTETARLLHKGLSQSPSPVPPESRGDVWAALATLVKDPNPTPEHEAEFGGSNMDPMTLSINTTRGEAMHTVIRYALWIREVHDAGGSTFDAMPEVVEVLEYHLDPAEDPALSIRAVYGRWFPWLHQLDKGWTVARVDRIFPPAAEDLARWSAAWEAYIVYCEPYNDIVEVLTPTYALAIDRLPATSDETKSLEDPVRRLAEHVLVQYMRCRLSLDDETGLVRRLFERAPIRVRWYALGYTGRLLRNTPVDRMAGEALDRLRRLWEWRVATVAAAPADQQRSLAGELTAFGDWFAAGLFPDDWALAQLHGVLQLARKIDRADPVAERLTVTVSMRPLASVQCLAGLLETVRESWGLVGWEDEVREVLRSALSGDVPEAQALARDLVHRLGELGYFDFRSLLKEQT